MNGLPTQIHMLGIGGMGMAPLAIYLQQTGIRVTGEDDQLNPHVQALLVRSGIKPVQGKAAERQRAQTSLMVRSSAVSSEDPRVLKAQENGIEVIRRGELLARLVGKRKLLAVVGSHGKTSTAAMLVHALRKKRFFFDYVLGGLYRDEQCLPAGYMGAEWVIAEVDESDGTINAFSPAITLALNFDWDHPDHYSSPKAMQEMFGALIERTTEDVIIPDDAPVLAQLVGCAGKKSYSFGQEGEYMGYPVNAFTDRFELELAGSFPFQRVSVAAGGFFNMSNALAALCATHVLTGEVEPDLLTDFPGVRRRQDRLYASSQLTVYADYAHHPNEIKALLNHYKKHTNGRVGVVFQPHRYTRTKQYAHEFSAVLEAADALFLLPVYAASESLDDSGKTERISELMPGSPPVCGDYASLEKALLECIDGLDTLLFIGAGDVDAYAQKFIQTLPASSSDIDWFDCLKQKVSTETVLHRDEVLAKKTTLRVGGKARFYAEPASDEDLKTILLEARAAGVKRFFLGRGSNLLIADEGYDGLVIHLHHQIWREVRKLDDERIEAGAGVRLQALSSKACKWGMAGFEFLEGIPGSLGGALRMNAGAMRGWMFDVVEQVEYISLDGEVHRMPKENFHVGYRHCEELKTAIATRAILRCPERQATESIRARMQEYSQKRVNSQPREPSAGCMFKNPEGGHAGKIIDELGLKGYRIGGAEISTKHGNFIVNHGDATSADVLAIMRHARERARLERGVELEPEVMLVGLKWEDVL